MYHLRKVCGNPVPGINEVMLIEQHQLTTSLVFHTMRQKVILMHVTEETIETLWSPS